MCRSGNSKFTNMSLFCSLVVPYTTLFFTPSQASFFSRLRSFTSVSGRQSIHSAQSLIFVLITVLTFSIAISISTVEIESTTEALRSERKLLRKFRKCIILTSLPSWPVWPRSSLLHLRTDIQCPQIMVIIQHRPSAQSPVPHQYHRNMVVLLLPLLPRLLSLQSPAQRLCHRSTAINLPLSPWDQFLPRLHRAMERNVHLFLPKVLLRQLLAAMERDALQPVHKAAQFLRFNHIQREPPHRQPRLTLLQQSSAQSPFTRALFLPATL